MSESESSREDWTPPPPVDTPGGHDGLETMLHWVRQAAKDWSFNDRLDMATKQRRKERA